LIHPSLRGRRVQGSPVPFVVASALPATALAVLAQEDRELAGTYGAERRRFAPVL
jgi:hypothetical protein